MRFEEAAEQAGVDGVLLGHIKGQFVYKGRGGVPYYVDGGAGGELYTEGPVGTDHGYWHGFRLLRVAGGKVTTDTVPIFVKDGIRLDGPGYLLIGADAKYEAFGTQPVFNDEAKVTGLELRDPDPIRPASSSGLGSVGDFVRGGGWIFVPMVLLVLGGLAMNGTLPRPRRRVAVAAAGLAGAGVIAVAGVSMAQQSSPTTTPLESLPVPARIFATSNPQVVAPVASRTDDPRRDPARQTEDGDFRARCPGAARVSITSGFETTSKAVRVASRRGRIVRARAGVPLALAARRPARPGAGVEGAPGPARAGAGADPAQGQDRAGAARRLPGARQQAADLALGRPRRRAAASSAGQRPGATACRCWCAPTAGRSAARRSWSCASAASPGGRAPSPRRAAGWWRGTAASGRRARPGRPWAPAAAARPRAARARGLQLGELGARLVQLLHRVLEAVLQRGHLLAQAQAELVALDAQIGDLGLASSSRASRVPGSSTAVRADRARTSTSGRVERRRPGGAGRSASAQRGAWRAACRARSAAGCRVRSARWRGRLARCRDFP